MRNARKAIDELRDIDVSTLNTLDKLLPVLKAQLELIGDGDLQLVNRGDIYSTKLPFFFLQYSLLTAWITTSCKIVRTVGNKDNEGYIDLTNNVSGYSTQPIHVRATVWLPWTVTHGEIGLDLSLFYGLVKDDIALIEHAMSTVTDPFFKNYYSERFASALQDVLLLVYTTNEMVAFYEWRR